MRISALRRTTVHLCLAVSFAAPAWAETDVEDVLLDAQAALVAKDHAKAVRLFEKAEKASETPSVEVLLGLAEALNGVGAFKDAAEAARRGLATEPEHGDRIRLVNQEANALVGLAGSDSDQLELAAKAFQAILDLTEGKEPVTVYNLGLVRLRQSRDEEGIALLERYLTLTPDGRYAERAESLIENPRRARESLVPDAALVTLGGEYITFDKLQGKVVLLDFWATWCSPCIAAMPALRRLARRIEKSPFVMISISADRDRAVLEQGIASHGMTWPQVWDQDNRLSYQTFGVRSFPTYVLVDHEGVIVSRLSGWGTSVERQLMADVAGAIRRAKKVAKAE